MLKLLKFAAIQINNIDVESVCERQMNIELAKNLIHKISQDVDIIVLPELFTSGYAENTFLHLDDIAETSQGESFRKLAEVAKQKNAYLIYGYPEVADQKYYITQNVIDREGKWIGKYRKMHLAQFGDSMEKNFFQPGNEIYTFTIHKNDTKYSIGIIICYDMRFPELTRKLALERNIDFLIHPVAFAKDNSFTSWHSFVITRALENQVYMLSLNRAGSHYGNSIFCPPWIDFNKKPQTLQENEAILFGEIDKKEIAKVRKTYSLRGDLKQKY